MKNVFIILAIAIFGIISTSAQKHYKMTVPNPEIPGDSIVYDIEEPSALDYRTHFIADFIRSIPSTPEGDPNVFIHNRGTVKAVFLLDKDGFIKDTQIVQKSGTSYEYKLVSIFNSAKPISPGHINGKPALFAGYFEISNCCPSTIKVDWTPLIGVNPE